MSRLSGKAIVGLFAILVAIAPLQGSVVTLTADPGVIHFAPSISTFSTHGALMDGMSVRVIFSDGSEQTVAWADTGATSGAASGTSTGGGTWNLAQSGQTFGAGGSDTTGSWTLTLTNGTVNIVQMILNGASGNTIFDRTLGGADGTPGSSLGADFILKPSNSTGTFNITAAYQNLVGLSPAQDCDGVSGSTPCSDLYMILSITFNSSGSPFSPGSSLIFRQDTDNASGQIFVPEPSTLALFGLGGTVLWGLRRRLRVPLS